MKKPWLKDSETLFDGSLPWRARIKRLLEKAVGRATDQAADGLMILMTAGTIFVPPTVATIEKVTVRYRLAERKNARQYRKIAIAFTRPILNQLGQTIALAIIVPVTIVATIGNDITEE